MAGVAVDVEAGLVTVTSTGPAAAASGAVTVICVAELIVRLLPATFPKCTADVPARLEPTMTTGVPPATGPIAPAGVGATVPVSVPANPPAKATLNVPVPTETIV